MPGAAWDGETLTISQSWLNTFRKCPEQARLKLIGELPDMPGPAALVGILAHAAIARLINDPSVIDQPVKLMETIEHEAQMEADAGNPFISSDIESDSIYALHCWLESGGLDYVSKLGNPRAEVEFEIALTEGVRLRGSTDLMHDDGCSDWKFPASMNSWSKEWEKIRYDVQPTAYLGALDRLDRRWEYYVVAWGADKPKSYTLPTGEIVERAWDQKVIPMTRNTGDWIALQREAAAIHNLVLSAGLEKPWPLRPTDWHCSPAWCDAYASCMGMTSWVEAEIRKGTTTGDGSFSYREWAKGNNETN